MKTMVKVSKEEYYNSFNHLDAICRVVGSFPYTVEWRLRGSETVIAKSVPVDSRGIKNDYFILK